LKLRSVKSIVIAPANTGKLNNNKIVVKKTDQEKREIFSIVKFKGRIFRIVQIKLIDPKIEDIPAK